MYSLYIHTTKAVQTISCAAGCSIADALRAAGILLDLPCGGTGRCGKCKVIATGSLPPLTPEELRHLSPEERTAGYRLACMARPQGDAHITLPEAAAMQIVAGGAGAAATQPLYASYGAAVDIGTTTLCVQLFGREGLLAERHCRNPQSAFGADVISRIAASLGGQAEALRSCLAKAIATLLQEAAAQAGLQGSAPDAMVITGNTAMLYLATATNPQSLSQAPFHADRLFGETLPGRALGLSAFADVPCYLPPCMGAYLGADIVTAILYSGMQQSAPLSLLADVGTNGEIALWANGTLYACSTAAGPAFEGAGISMGSLGIPGAIDSVRLEGSALRCTTIANAPPKSICGSGIIDAVATLLQAGVLEDTGAFTESDAGLPGRIIEKSGAPAALLAGEVSLTQQDVRAVQLAKAAIHAGICTLLREAGVPEHSRPRCYLAGGFGTHLRLENAISIGLLPPLCLPNTAVLGNAALSGAALLLQDKSRMEDAQRIASAARIIELAGNPGFMDCYVESMLFSG